MLLPIFYFLLFFFLFALCVCVCVIAHIFCLIIASLFICLSSIFYFYFYFFTWVNVERHRNGNNNISNRNKMWLWLSYEELFLKASKKKKKKCNLYSNKSVYYICLPPCKSLLLVKGWQLTEKDVVEKQGEDRVFFCSHIPNKPSPFPRSSSEKVGECDTSNICINKRDILGISVLPE